ncbi:CAP-Gly domain-containing linker protein 3 isoform X2 [Nematostella vectensis]|uniref:CAP-Gly domain-containing linker protein 3 isoform X2 n=1 Tax=Nematostella vectensis TaxID=45351 RepID=UPI0013905F92|nr:CAP-Gly domain-containing linker protein 3 isoform X2 [Nematostella vectensis]
MKFVPFEFERLREKDETTDDTVRSGHTPRGTPPPSIYVTDVFNVMHPLTGNAKCTTCTVADMDFTKETDTTQWNLVPEEDNAQLEFEANLPEGWIISKSRQHGRMYYFNTETAESRWQHPLIPEDSGNHETGVPSFDVSNGYTARENPITHPASDPVLCEKCQKMDLTFFDPNCPSCYDVLQLPTTTIPQVFAIMRQWVPQVQQNIELFIQELLRRGAHLNDRDGLTDMCVLHYACKAGAVGVGDIAAASNVISGLIAKGADVSQKCRWTDMLPLHYATFFDAAPVIRILLKESHSKDVNTRCKEFEAGTALHIAATNLCFEAARCLLQHGADAYLRDKLNRTPRECVPDVSAYDPESEPAIVAEKMTRLLSEAEPLEAPKPETENQDANELTIGERVYIGGTKSGVLRFCGRTEFASGEWVGVELDQPVGKNDGSVDGVQYFQCEPNHGIFAPASKVTRNGTTQHISRLKPRASRRPPGESTLVTSQPNSRPSSRPSSRPNSRSPSPTPSPRLDDSEIARDFQIGEHVLVAGQKPGIVQFIGQTQFASGWWLGIELSNPVGKNDGSVGGVRYFTCKPRFGVFAPVAKVTKNPDPPKFEETFVVPTAPAPKIHHGSHSSLHETTSSHGSLSDLSRMDSNPDLRHSSNRSTNSSNPDLSQRRGSADRSGSKPQKKAPNAEFRLSEGMSILVNSELGVVRYIGETDFAEGIWLGVEMRKPVGKNDGSVNGKRYFTVKPNYGLMVRPGRASCRGINCAKLVEEVTS